MQEKKLIALLNKTQHGTRTELAKPKIQEWASIHKHLD
jgi:hypothetical protein